jgi:hypothetical protein
MTPTPRPTLILPLVLGLLAACGSAAPAKLPGNPGGAGRPASTSTGGSGGASLVDAASKIKDPCTVTPMELAAQIVPGGQVVGQPSPFPPRCTYTNNTSVLEITIGAYDTGGPVTGAEQIPGLAAGGYLTRPTPDDAYLTVLLAPDQGELYVEVAGHDGKDHKDDAVAVAQRILAALH